MEEARYQELKADFDRRWNLYTRGIGIENEKKPVPIDQRNNSFLTEQDIKDREWTIFKAVHNGLWSHTARGILGTAKAIRDVNIATKPQGDTELKPGFEGVLESAIDSNIVSPYNIKTSGMAEEFAVNLAEGGGQLLGQALATAGATLLLGPVGGAAASTGLMGAQIAGNQYLDLTKDGVAPERAATAALANAAIQAPMERLSLTKIMKGIPAGSGIRKKLRQVAESAITEGTTEFLQEYPEAITDIIAKNEEMSGGELAGEFAENAGTITKQAAYSGLIGAILGGGASSIRVALQRNIQKAKVEKIEERANAIKKSGADPAYAAGVINVNLNGATVAVDGGTLYEYAQSQNLEEVASDLGVDPETIKDAAEQGLDVEIMQGNLEATGAKRADFLPAIKNDLAFDNDGVTINNIQVQKELSKQSEALDAAEKEFAEWKDDQLGQMRNAGLNKEEALHTLALLESAARTYNPSDPSQYFRDHPLEIKRVVSTPSGRYVQTRSANEKLLEDEKKFSYLVDGLDKVNEHSTYHVMTTPLALELAGGKLLPVTIDGIKLKHIFDNHSDGMDKEIVKQVPRAMTDPLMILDSYDGRKVVVLDLKDKQGSTIILPMEIEVEKKRYKVNAINNAYGKGDVNGTNYNWFIEHNLKKGRALYINKEKTANWLSQSPSSDSASRGFNLDSLLTDSIPNENDLRKRKAEMDGYYQKNFVRERPRIDTDMGAEKQRQLLVNEQKEDIRKRYKGTSQWMKAPNGAATNLTEDQWLTVRTDAFKKWFGDWEVADALKRFDEQKGIPLPVKAITATENLKPIDAAIVWGEEHGLYKESIQTIIGKVVVDARSIKNSLSHGFGQMKLDAITTLKEGLPIAVKMEELDDTAGNQIKNTFLTYKVMLGDTPCAVVCRVRTDMNIQKLYIHEVFPENKIKTEPLQTAAALKQPHGGPRLFRNIISRFFNADNRASSKVVDENGEPLVVYHGTGADFNVFDKRKQGDNYAQGEGAFFFTDKYSTAKNYGILGAMARGNNAEDGKVMAAFLNIQNPVIREVSEEYYNSIEHFDNDSANLLNYRWSEEKDGIIIRGDKTTLVAAFEPNQIKSATDNVGTFDSKNPNILYQNDRGSITWDEKGKAIVSLFQGSDPSTVIHEAVGHYFIENLMHDGARAEAPEQMRKDRKTMLDYAELTEKQWAELDKPRELLTEEQWQKKTAAHERWAAAAEQYIMLGKAPSFELRAPMQRFKTWLLKTYETIQKFVAGNQYAVEITPEVTEVFDRLLASEKEIEEVIRVEGYFAKLPSAITDQLSDKSKNRLQDFILQAKDKAVSLLQKKSLENFTDERKAQIEEYRAEILPDVQKEIAAQPLYAASKMLEEDFGKKSSRNIVNRYYELIHRTKSSDTKPLTDEEALEVMHFDTLAEEMGFKPDELAMRILNEPTYKEAVTKRADELVREKFPDVMAERKAKAEAVKNALYNDDTGLVIATELQIIEDAAAGALQKQRSAEDALNLARATRQQARAAAKADLEKMSIENAINVRRYMQAERKAFAKAIEFAAKKDYVNAIAQKRLQAYHHAMAMESAAFKVKVSKQLAYVQRQRKAKKETWGAEQHFFQAAELLRRMGVERKDYAPKQRTQTLAEYVKDVNENGDQNADIAPWLLDETISLEATTRTLTTGQLQDIIDALRNIKAIGKYEQNVRVAEKTLALDGVVDQILGALDGRKIKWEDGPNAKKTEKGALSHIKGYLAESENADTFFAKMDDWNEDGIFTQVFRIPIQAAADMEADYSLRYDQAISDAIKDLAPTRENRNALAREEWNEALQANICRYNLMKMLAYLGTQSSSDKLCSAAETSTFKAFFPKSELWVQGDLEQTRSNLLEFLGHTLTEKEIEYTQKIIDAANAPWKSLQEVEYRTKGFTPKKEDAFPATLTLANGRQVIFKGGYLPLVRHTDSGSKPRAANIIKPTDEHTTVNNLRTMSTVAGSTKVRDKSVYPLDLRADAEVLSIKETIHDLAFREAIDAHRKILSDENVYRELKRVLGLKRFSLLLRYIENAAQPGSGENQGSVGEFGALINILRRKLTNVVILGNIKVITQNIGNIALYGANVEGYSHARAIRAIVGFYKNIHYGGYWQQQNDFVYEKSSWMRERAKAPDFSLALVKEEQGRQEGYKKFIQDVCVDAMVFTDNMTAIPIWMDAYNMKRKAGVAEKEAVRYADTVIRRGLGATRNYDVAPIMRSGPWAKLFTMFQSFANARYNEAVREKGLIGKHLGKEEYGDAFKRAVSYIIAKHFIFTALSTALAFENPFEDDDDGWNKWLKELLLYPHTMIGPVGSFTNSMTSLAFGMRTFGYRISPIQSVPEQALNFGKKVQRVSNGKGELGDLVEPAAGLLGLIFEVPGQFNKLIFNAYDILYNDMTPKASDLIRRRPKRERAE